MAANLAGDPSLSGSATSYSLDVVSLIRQINAMSNADPQKFILRTALSDSIRPIWALLCGLSGLALLTTIFIKHYDLNQQLTTEQGFDGQEKKKIKEAGGDPESATAAAAVLPVAAVGGGEKTDVITRDVSHDTSSEDRMVESKE